MADYKINGNLCTTANGCAPSKHTIAPAQRTLVKTVGGIIVIEPPEGQVRVHTWVYDGRQAKWLGRLLSFLDLANSPVVRIDTFDVIQDEDGTFPLLRDIVCTCQIPEITTAGRRDLTEGFSLQFSELYVQT